MRTELTLLLWVALLLVLWATVATIGIMYYVVIQAMVADVNSQLEDSRKFSETWWYPGKLQRLLSEHHRRYPTGERIRKLQRLSGLFVVFAVVGAAIAAGWRVAVFFGVFLSAQQWLLFRKYTA